jgi:5-methylcytosine-specific restriction endonuclease McrA
MPHRVPTFRPPWLAARPRERRPNSSARGYGSAAWQRVRLAVIARDGGICQMCRLAIRGAGEAHVDHIEEKPLHEAAEATPLSGLRLLCRSCHSKKTAAACP